MELIIQFCIILIALTLGLFVGEWKIACIILTVSLLCMFIVSVLHHRRKEKQLSELVLYLMKVQDRMELPELQKCEEGQFGILQSEIYKLVVLLKEQSQHATRQNVYLADMLSDISHQIKTPLTSITIMTELLENPGLPIEKREEFISNINQQVDRITWLIKNLLTLSQLEADVLKLKKEKISVNALLQKACQPFEVMAEVKDVNLDIQATEEIECVCDIHWTVEAISNIIKNCIEHTPSGGTVAILVEQNNFATNIRISDNGEGISKEHLPHIFERFYKGRNTSSNSVGIGLSMSKQIIMRQNGMVSVTSEEGKGTTFQVKIYRG